MIARLEIDATDEALGRYLIEVEYPNTTDWPTKAARMVARGAAEEAMRGMAAMFAWDELGRP